MEKHYMVIAGDDIYLFRNLEEVHRCLSNSVIRSQLKPIIDKVVASEPNSDIYCSANVNGVVWEIHQSDPSEEPEELKFFYEENE